MRLPAALVAFCLLGSSAQAQIVKLSDTPVTGGDVLAGGLSLLTPDGSRIVYRGDITTDEVTELYSASTTTAGTQIKISSTPVTGGDIPPFSLVLFLTPDGSRAVYLGDLTTDDVQEVYSASTSAAGTQIKISSTPVTNGDVANSSLSLTPDGSRALYRGDLTADEVQELYSASTTAAGTQIKISNTPVGSGDVMNFVVSANGARALYLGDLTTNDVIELYSASTTTAGTQVTISSTPGAGRNIDFFAFTADSARAVYRGDLTTDDVMELYGASATTAGTQIKLSNTPVAGGDVFSPMLTPNGSRVVFTGDLTTDGVAELYSASTTAAGSQIKISSTPVAGGNILAANARNVTPDSSRIIYLGDLSTDNVFELYSASTTAANTQIKISSTPVTGGNVSSSNINLTPDGSRAVYLGDLETDGMMELFSASTTASNTQIKLNNTMGASHDIVTSYLAISSDGQLVAFIVDTDGSGQGNDLYLSSVFGGGATLLASTPNQISYIDFAGNSLVFRSDMDAVGVFQQYSVVLPVPVPEPGTYCMLGLAGMALVWWKRRQQRRPV